MLHVFSFNQESFAFDSESGALSQIDALAKYLLEAKIATKDFPDEAALKEAAKTYGFALAELKEAREELQALFDEGIFGQPAFEATPEQLYPDGPRIKAMCLHICHDCNLRCRYCFAGTGDFGMGKRSMLSLETGKAAVDYLIRASGPRRNLDIDFFGGEPLMNWPVVKALVHYCEAEGPKHGKKIRLTITTNASLLNDEKIAFINAHFKNCVLSIDGRPKIHDLMRPDIKGRGSYEQCAKGIKAMLEARGDKEYYLRGTYTAHNTDFADDVFSLAELGPQVSVEPVVCDPKEPYALGFKHLPKLASEYERLAIKMHEERKQGKGFHFFHFNIDQAQTPCRFKRLKGCGVGTEYCAVTPEGDIYPCHQMVGEAQFKMGNVLDTKEAKAAPVFDALLLANKEACKACWARYYCGGGCPANAYHSSGRVDGLDLFSCELQKKRLECALWLAAKGQTEPQGGDFSSDHVREG